MGFTLYLIYLVLILFRPFEVYVPELAALRPMAIMGLLAFVSASASVFGRKEIATSKTTLLLLGGFVGAIAFSQIMNGWLGGATNAISDFSVSLLFFYLTVANLTRADRIQRAAAVTMWSIVLLALQSVISYYTGFLAEQLVLRQNSFDETVIVDLPTIPAEDADKLFLWRIRSVGFLSDPNDFGQMIVMVLPLLAGSFLQAKSTFYRILVAMAAGLLFFAIYLTQSRGAMVGVLAILALIAHRRLGTVVVGVLVVGAVLAMSVVDIGGRGLSSGEASASERIDAWWAGIEMLKAHPLSGVGYGMFTEHHYLTAHNSFVLCFAELGLLGYFFWVALLVIAYIGLKQVVTQAPRQSVEYRQALVFGYSFVGFMTCAWFLSRTYLPTLFLLLGLCMSVIWCARQQFANVPDAQQWETPKWFLKTMMVMFLTIGGVYGFVALRQ